MSDSLQQGIAALKAGDKAQARRFFGRAIQENPQDEQAWLWLSGAVESDNERLTCLNKVLAINPDNPVARRGIGTLQQKLPQKPPGLPAQTPPIKAPPRPSQPLPKIADDAISATSSPASGQSNTRGSAAAAAPRPPQVDPAPQLALDDSLSLEELSPEARKALEGYVQLVAQELRSGKNRKVVIEQLATRGFPRQAVIELVGQVAHVLNRVQVQNYRKKMVRGLLIAAAGIAVTCITALIAARLGGVYYVLYGAILAGLVDFVGGLIGWLAHRV